MSQHAEAYVWPTLASSLETLSRAQLANWERDGYLIVPNVISPSLTAAAATTVRRFIGADDSHPSTWYSNTLDIYLDRTPSGKKPHHGPSGMVQLFHHRTLWAIRQEPRVHSIFADLYGTRRLYVTADRAHFKPPQNADFPAWSHPGDVHVGLHWDTDTRRAAWPVPYVIQGVVYLENTTAVQGALRVVPGFHRRLASWESTQMVNRSAERPEGASALALEAEAIPVEGTAGSLVLWHSLLPHGPAPNVGTLPRVSAYVAMLPVDAAPFLGGRPAETPLSTVDAGTLHYLEDMNATDRLPLHTFNSPANANGRGGDSSSTCAKGSNGRPKGAAGRRVARQTREQRARRYYERLPLLDEDPLEDELSALPPDEEHRPLAPLSPLGQRLAGVVEWEKDGIIRLE
ncbi:hypothetical protein AB1Y20_003741 [Prymnesium parvum]|uniref:Phytanoyl-CoA dioxygenase n=1 Tax=Prymnesium parvum TaxID=97485 RepID=A0AB34J7W8_PRYPA